MQVIAIGLYLQRDDWASQWIRSHAIPRIDSQISVSGEQPLETARTKSWNYTTENLYHFFLIGLMANNVGHDLFNYSNPSGGGYKKALDYAIPYVEDPLSWPHKMIVPFDIKRLQAAIQIADSIYADARYQEVIEEQDWGKISLRYSCDNKRVCPNHWFVSASKRGRKLRNGLEVWPVILECHVKQGQARGGKLPE